MNSRSTVLVLLYALATGWSSANADKRVLMIGVDGAGGSYTQTAVTPNIDALAANGAVRYDWLNEGALIPNPPEPYGASGVNWTTINTGVSAASHGVSDNGFGGNNLDEFPHWFTFVEAFDPSLYTASIVNWSPINTQILPDGVADQESVFTGSSASFIDNLVRDATVDLLQNGDPHAVFLHFDQVDSFGHGFSWGSPTYFNAINAVDGLIGDVMSALNSRPGVINGDEDWLVMISADHGGAQGAFGHVASQGPINWEVPFVISGPGVPNGVALPQGTLRDMAPTALWHLGIDPFGTTAEGNVVGIPYVPLGAPNGIEGDINQDGVVSGDGTGPAASDDVTAFIDGWFQTGASSIAEAYGMGDLNLDKRTDLADWLILNQLDPAMGVAALAALNAVPEPASATLCGLALAVLSSCRRRR